MSADRPAPSDVVLGATVRREDLVRCLVDSGRPVRTSRAMVNTIVGAVIDRLEQGHDVRLRGFGQFNIRESAVRNGRDFSTGALVPIASRPRVVFRASPGLVRDMTEALVGAVPAGEE